MSKLRAYLGPILNPILSPNFRVSVLGLIEDFFSNSNKPPRHIPWNLLKSYTLGGRIPLGYRYLNDAQQSNEPRIYTKEMIESHIRRIQAKDTFYYGETDAFLYQALDRFSIRGKRVAVLGSVRPLYESMCLFYGAEPTTIEYNRIISEDPRLKTITVSDFKKSPAQFDAAFSISSFEHDGLGRYGDPLDPQGDLIAMRNVKGMLKPDGLLFLAVPIGKDRLVWNAHRIYGDIRLPLLLKEWTLLDSFGFSDDLKKQEGYQQPVFVLRNKASA